MSVAEPPISVVIATRDRGDNVVRVVESILKNDDPGVEILVIDQSANNACEECMSRYSGEPRVLYQRSRTAGVSRARNLGIEQARGDIVAITDDDCIVPENWLEEIRRAFREYPGVAIVFGNVLPSEHDSKSGFVPGYVRDETKVISSVLDKNDVDGLGACMALRSEVWRECHGFDNMLGVGGALHSSSEGDLVLRALHKGYRVCETPRVFTTHTGFRSWQEGQRLIHRYWYGTGAMYGKHIKMHPVRICGVLGLLAWRWAFGRSRVAASIGPRSRRVFRLYCFASGFLTGLFLGVNRSTGHFRAPELRGGPRQPL